MLSCVALALGQEGATARQLFLLSGTPTEKRPQSYPVLLYKAGTDKKLEVVREVIAGHQGLRVIRVGRDAIFAVHPHVAATTVSIIHTDDPARKDDVVFSEKGTFPNTASIVIAEPKGFGRDLLIPWAIDSGDSAQHIVGTVASVSSTPSGLGRVKVNAWDEYTSLRYDGGTGGPEIVAPLVGSIVGNSLAVALFGHTVVVDSLPPALRSANPKLPLVIVASSEEYLLLLTRNETPPDKLPAWELVFVHNRKNNGWSSIRVEGNWSQSRLFGPWLATLVRMANVDRKVGPGRERERAVESDLAPNIQGEYAAWAGRYYWIPGVLEIQNLRDGRIIRIETAQEDSEILRVEGDAVLYRVNDTIYQARIEGSQLKDTTVVVKDEDVPEIHWAFWSKAAN